MWLIESQFSTAIKTQPSKEKDNKLITTMYKMDEKSLGH
jgi:hypothetical protein